MELEIAASGPISPRAQIVTGPDRLVLDFPNAVPAKGLHDIELDRGDLKGARIGLFSSNPMTTRVVLDLKSPQTYKLFPSGNTVIVKIGENASKSQVAAAKPADDDEETVISVEKPEGSEVTVLAKATPDERFGANAGVSPGEGRSRKAGPPDGSFIREWAAHHPFHPGKFSAGAE